MLVAHGSYGHINDAQVEDNADDSVLIAICQWGSHNHHDAREDGKDLPFILSNKLHAWSVSERFNCS